MIRYPMKTNGCSVKCTTRYTFISPQKLIVSTELINPQTWQGICAIQNSTAVAIVTILPKGKSDGAKTSKYSMTMKSSLC